MNHPETILHPCPPPSLKKNVLRNQSPLQKLLYRTAQSKSKSLATDLQKIKKISNVEK